MKDTEAAEVAKALSHPLRIEVLRALRERPAISAVEYSRESRQPLGNVSYHVRALLSAGVIAEDELVPRRGAVEHRYSLSGKQAEIAIAMLELLSGA
jgi:DNA-binding transcriptional ArsR family regulator